MKKKRISHLSLKKWFLLFVYFTALTPFANALDLSFSWTGHYYSISENNISIQVRVAKDDWSIQPASSFKVKIYAQDTWDWTTSCSIFTTSAFDDLIGEKTVSPFLGSSDLVSFSSENLIFALWPYSPSVPRTYCLYAVVDADDDIDETNENNNRYTFPDPFTFPIDSTAIDPSAPSFQISIGPNPVSNLLILKLGVMPQSSARARILDSAGRVVLDQKIFGVETQFDVSRFTPGSYILGVTTDGTAFVTKPFIRQ